MKCVFCNHHSENNLHLFVEYPFTCDVINVVNDSGAFPLLSNLEVGWSFLDFVCESKSHMNATSLSFYAIIW